MAGVVRGPGRGAGSCATAPHHSRRAGSSAGRRACGLPAASSPRPAGNTLVSMTSYLIGRIVPNRASAPAVARVRRYGYPVLLFAWLPVVGDALPLAAGWLRLGAWQSAAVIALGKFARYLVV
ncbi:DedA family protein, partial [Lacticaseibacillus rhamnosus]